MKKHLTAVEGNSGTEYKAFATPVGRNFAWVGLVKAGRRIVHETIEVGFPEVAADRAAAWAAAN